MTTPLPSSNNIQITLLDYSSTGTTPRHASAAQNALIHLLKTEIATRRRCIVYSQGLHPPNPNPYHVPFVLGSLIRQYLPSASIAVAPCLPGTGLSAVNPQEWFDTELPHHTDILFLDQRLPFTGLQPPAFETIIFYSPATPYVNRIIRCHHLHPERSSLRGMLHIYQIQMTAASTHQN